MPVYKVEKNRNYTVMSNCHLRDARLSWKAKGLLSYILSLPGDWDFSAVGLASAVSDGVAATRTALRELEKYGYLIRRPIREGSRISDWEYIIYEVPREGGGGNQPELSGRDGDRTGAPENGRDPGQEAETGLQEVDFQQAENQEVENQGVENRTQLNTKEIITEEPITEETKTQSIINNNNITDSIHTSVRGAPEDGVTEILRDAERAVAEANASLKKNAESRRAMDARFERFWEVWPRKVARKAARSAFERLAPDDGMTDRMIAAVRLQMERDSRFRETRYTPHPATWINGAEWENGYDEPKKESSFDTDEFFELAVRKSQESVGRR